MAPSRRSPVDRRIRLLLAFLVVAFALLLARAVWLQGVRAGSLGALATKQHLQTVALPAARGTIFDRTGVELAIGEQTTTVFADPQQVRNAIAVSRAAHTVLGVDGNELYSKLQDKKTRFVYVQRFADPAKALLLQKRGLAGVGFYPEERRTYPQGKVGAQVGRSLPRLEAREKVTGRAEYTHIMRLPGMLHGKIFRSTIAHGRIKSIDTSAAREVPGVYRVVTSEDVRKVIPEPYYGPAFHDQPILAIDKVHYVGEPVAVVLASDPHVAEEAAQLIVAEY